MYSLNRFCQNVFVCGFLCTSFFIRYAFSIPTGLENRQTNTTDVSNTTASTPNPTNTTEFLEDPVSPGWVSGPTTRGTLNIIFPCIITLFLCIWTTVQVNIEPKDNENKNLFKLIPALENKWLGKFLASRIVRKVGWSCVTIIVPEATLAVAAYERRTALLLREATKKVTDHDDKQIHEFWDPMICYYAVMGGFVIEPPDHTSRISNNDGQSPPVPDPEKVNDDPGTALRKQSVTSEASPATAVQKTSKVDRAIARLKDPRKDGNQRRTLTPQGVYLLHQHKKLPRLIPDKTKDEGTITLEDAIKDKNKASKLTKGIVFFQALWMIMQVIARTAGALPVTLLELHTCLHTFCALAMYATWWDKPVDVDFPVTIKIDDPDLLDKLYHNTGEWETGNEDAEQEGPEKKDSESTKQIKTAVSPLGPDCARIRYLTTRAGLGKLLWFDLFGEDLLDSKSYFKTWAKGYERLWKSRKLLWKEALFISLVGLVYGGVHLAAWRNRFPTLAERNLWRAASAITAVAWSGFVLSLWMGKRRFFRKLCGFLFGVCVFPCLFVRLYLFFESFISLRRLPQRSYDINIWTELWPHAG